MTSEEIEEIERLGKRKPVAEYAVEPVPRECLGYE